MKKLFSILFSLVFILSGMHLSFDTHYCDGKLFGWKVSLDEEKASCGMCSDKTLPVNSITDLSCCQDVLSVMKVDSNFRLSKIELSAPSQPLIQVFLIPQHIGCLIRNRATSLYANVRPPGNKLPVTVNLADICVFQI